jgi:hypothetical protein
LLVPCQCGIQELQWYPIEMPACCPSNEHVMVHQRPSIGCKVETPWVVLEEFCYMLLALLISCLDVMSNSVWRRDCEVGVSCCEEVNKLRVRDDGCRVISVRRSSPWDQRKDQNWTGLDRLGPDQWSVYGPVFFGLVASCPVSKIS